MFTIDERAQTTNPDVPLLADGRQFAMEMAIKLPAVVVYLLPDDHALLDGKHPAEREKEEFSPISGYLSLPGNDGRNQLRPGPAVRHLRSWNRGSA